MFRKNIINSLIFCLLFSIAASSRTFCMGGFNNNNNNAYSISSIMRAYPLLFSLAAGSVMSFIAYTLYSFLNRNIPNQRFNRNPINYNYPTFLQWNVACQELPMYHQVDENDPNKYKNTGLTRQEFERAVRAFCETMQESEFGDNQNWRDNNGPDDLLFDIQNISKNNRERFFAQKLLLPSNAEISMHADIHGDLHSLLKYINDLSVKGYLNQDNPFVIEDPNFYMIFLGDYTDRGYYGADILYTIFRLKEANPDRVILIRGNHEDVNINCRYGLLNELRSKFEYEFDDLRRLCKVYNLMSTAVYIGTGRETKNYALFCHGGLEPGFNPQNLLADPRENVYQWIETIDVSWLSQNLKQNLTNVIGLNQDPRIVRQALDMGFIWNDFIVDNGTGQAGIVRGRGYEFGRPVVQEILRQASVAEHRLRVMFTGHQHSVPMIDRMVENHGLYNSWSDYQWRGQEGTSLLVSQASPVWTLNVSPCSVYGTRYLNYNYDTYAILKLDDQFDRWLLEPHNVEVFNQDK